MKWCIKEMDWLDDYEYDFCEFCDLQDQCCEVDEETIQSLLEEMNRNERD